MWVAGSRRVGIWPLQQAPGSPVVTFTSDTWSSLQPASFLQGHVHFPSPRPGDQGLPLPPSLPHTNELHGYHPCAFAGFLLKLPHAVCVQEGDWAEKRDGT